MQIQKGFLKINNFGISFGIRTEKGPNDAQLILVFPFGCSSDTISNMRGQDRVK
jgi:hypothetical protein